MSDLKDDKVLVKHAQKNGINDCTTIGEQQMKRCHYNVPKIIDYVLKRHVKDSKPTHTTFLTLRLYMWEKTDDNY